ncbi:hypothetical protein Cni_G13568 [Canna indica]|uniref:Uncharacterized protein n=1 Tax=Canna indica TaxID=4628 RepID=A0AAQ3QCU4_9LILI|nr:hypothetical protein Cni_G13568 [Canna indica]
MSQEGRLGPHFCGTCKFRGVVAALCLLGISSRDATWSWKYFCGECKRNGRGILVNLVKVEEGVSCGSIETTKISGCNAAGFKGHRFSKVSANQVYDPDLQYTTMAFVNRSHLLFLLLILLTTPPCSTCRPINGWSAKNAAQLILPALKDSSSPVVAPLHNLATTKSSTPPELPSSKHKLLLGNLLIRGKLPPPSGPSQGINEKHI